MSNTSEQIPGSGQPAQSSQQPKNFREQQNSNQIFRYPRTLATSPEYQNFISFEMFETGGVGISSNKNKSDGAAVFLGSMAGGVAGEQLLSRLGGSLGSSILGKLGGAIGGFSVLSLITSGVGSDLLKNLGGDTFTSQSGRGNGDFGYWAESSGMNTANAKVDKTICLYMPSSLKATYGAEYEDNVDLTATALAATTLKLTAQSIKNFVLPSTDSIKGSLNNGVGDQLGRQALKTVSTMVTPLGQTVFGGDIKLDKLFEGQTRKVQNPMLMNLFKGVARRSFTFSFKFIPTSPEELSEVYTIITLFKKYAMPKRADGSGGRMLDYPAEFRIKFWHGATENLFLPKITRCCLKTIDVTYGEAPFTTFAPEPGLGAAPTSYTLDLTFDELEILVQQRIDQGY